MQFETREIPGRIYQYYNNLFKVHAITGSHGVGKTRFMIEATRGICERDASVLPFVLQFNSSDEQLIVNMNRKELKTLISYKYLKSFMIGCGVNEQVFNMKWNQLLNITKWIHPKQILNGIEQFLGHSFKTLIVIDDAPVLGDGVNNLINVMQGRLNDVRLDMRVRCVILTTGNNYQTHFNPHHCGTFVNYIYLYKINRLDTCHGKQMTLDQETNLLKMIFTRKRVYLTELFDGQVTFEQLEREKIILLEVIDTDEYFINCSYRQLSCCNVFNVSTTWTDAVKIFIKSLFTTLQWSYGVALFQLFGKSHCNGETGMLLIDIKDTITIKDCKNNKVTVSGLVEYFEMHDEVIFKFHICEEEDYLEMVNKQKKNVIHVWICDRVNNLPERHNMKTGIVVIRQENYENWFSCFSPLILKYK